MTRSGEGLLVHDLAREIAEGQVVAVVGAGVSTAANGAAPAASWTGLLHIGVERCEQLVPGLPRGWGDRVRGELESGDIDELLIAAEKVTRRLGGSRGGEYHRWLSETVGRLKVVDPAVPEALACLGVPLVTTNYDDLLEGVTGLPFATWRDGSSVQRILRNPAMGIVHLHGHWSRPDSVVLGIRSYEEVLGDSSAQAMLRALAVFRSFLLVGFGAGLNDPNFYALRSWMADVLSDSEYRHYRLVLEGELQSVAAEHLSERISAVAYGSHHADLPVFLRRLRSHCDASRSAGTVGKAVGRRKTRVGVLRSSSDGGLERRYREVALRAFDIIDLANLPENDRHLATRELELRRLYVALQVEVEAPSEAEMGEADLLGLERRRAARLSRTWGVPGPFWREGTLRVPVGERLGATRRLVVLGDPGAGKSTLLRWLATAYLLRLGQDPDLVQLPDSATLPAEDWLPVLVRCRDLDPVEVTGSLDEALRRGLRKLDSGQATATGS